MTRVSIVAASAVVRAGLEAIIGSRSELEHAGSFSSLEELRQESGLDESEVVLAEFDRGRSFPSPLSSVPALALPPVVLLLEDPDEELEPALRSGAFAVLPRDAAGEEITAAVEAVAAGLVVLHRSNIASLLGPLPSPRLPVEGPIESLTPREVEVLTMVAEGVGNKTIAHQLSISEHTVKFHVGSILSKLGAGSRTEAVTTGVRLGLILL